MSDHEVILKDLEYRAEKMDNKADAYGEDMGVPYRDTAKAIRDVVKTYGQSTPSVNLEDK